MATTITLKRRINSVKSIRQITKALQLVAASKLKRSQDYASRSRAYAELAEKLGLYLASLPELKKAAYFQKRPLKNVLYVVISSNSGLAGAYNSNVIRDLTKSIKSDDLKNPPKVIAIGNKAANFCRSIKGLDLIAVYNSFSDQPTANDIRPILNTMVDFFKDLSVDQVTIIYTKSISNINQKVINQVVLPLQIDLQANDQKKPAFTNFEPDIDSVIDEISFRLVEASLWQALLESLMSENAMRMVAMKNATDNAKNLIDDYTLTLNTVRQSKITQELAEISGGVEALK